jgi:hypothetical protein
MEIEGSGSTVSGLSDGKVGYRVWNRGRNQDPCLDFGLGT